MIDSWPITVDSPSHIDMFVGPVSVDIAAEIDVSPVELLERLGHLHREADNLIGRQLFLQRSSWLGAVIDDPAASRR